MTKQEAWEDLVKLARSINPNLPADLSGHEINISMSIHGCFATAIDRGYRLKSTTETK